MTVQLRRSPRESVAESLAGLEAVRFARHYYHFREAVHFYRDLVGLPVYRGTSMEATAATV